MFQNIMNDELVLPDHISSQCRDLLAKVKKNNITTIAPNQGPNVEIRDLIGRIRPKITPFFRRSRLDSGFRAKM